MRHNRKLRQLFYTSILLILFYTSINGQQEQRLPLSSQDVSSYSVEKLEKLVNSMTDAPEALPYYKLLLDKALKENAIPAAYNALFGIVEHYLSNQDLEQLSYWVDYTDSLVLAQKDNPKIYYDAHSNKACLLLEQKEYEQAITETIRLYNKAEKTDHKYGIVCSSEMLGNIYLSSQQDSAAVEAFQNAYDRLKGMGQYPNFHVKIMSCLLEAHMRLNNVKEVEYLLKEFETVLIWKENEDQRLGIQRKTNWYRWQLYSFYADLHLRKGEIEKAAKFLDQSAQYFESDMTASYDFSIYYYLYVKASYLKKVKKYAEALAVIDFILNDFHESTVIKLKIDILCETGKFKEALSLYQDLYAISKKTNNEAFVRQVNNLQAMYDKNDQLIQERELQLINLQVITKRRLIIFAMAGSIIFLIIIFFLAKFLRHTIHLKNELECDKNALVSSQEKLKKEKKKAEVADQEKDAFIANISHEIRTPLNAIVGFSTLLSEMPLEETEKKDFIELIEKNSSLLLDLVNDVLDLSRLESGRTRMTIVACELAQCCQKLLDGITDQLSPDVRLTFSPSVSPFFLNTDARLLSQLLDNLLSNSAKFTIHGEINLAYETDDVKRQVCFSVTDTGPGIPLDKQHIIFERFEKLDEYTQGSGLGLTLCQTIAQKLGGYILIDGDYTAGARFLFIHPYDIPDTSIPNEN